MKHPRLMSSLIGAAGAATIAVGPGAARAQRDTVRTAAGTVTMTSRVDPDAMDALKRMGAYLRTLKSMQVIATVTTEEVVEDGEKVQSTSVVNMIAERPNKLFADVANDRQPRKWFYDGKTFTLWAPRVKFYAQANAPPTIEQLADTLDDRFGIDLPFVDLFRWGTPESDEKEITSATDVGPAAVNGVTCEQYAFRQDGLDWQVWVQQGDFPLPIKLVLTTTDDAARPQHSTTYSWSLTPSYNDQTFVFTPPEGAKKITFKEVASARAAAKEKAKKGEK